MTQPEDKSSNGNEQGQVRALVPFLAGPRQLAKADIPALIKQAGPAARIAWDDFFSAYIRNPHTRALYRRAVFRFFAWLGPAAPPLHEITPAMVGRYFDERGGSVTARKVELAALRRFFDVLVTRHLCMLNPAASVRGERYQAIEGLTPEVTVHQARELLASIRTDSVAGQRDRAVIAVLIYTTARAGAVANLKLKHFEHDGSQYMIRFGEKGGKQRMIPCRHDLEQYIRAYLDAANLGTAPRESPLFRSLTRKGKSGTASERPMTGVDICRMVKRRLRAASLPPQLSPHSFRVLTVTDLLSQGVPLEDVQFLAGHADPRTTRLYDRRQKQVTRNIVERISV